MMSRDIEIDIIFAPCPRAVEAFRRGGGVRIRVIGNSGTCYGLDRFARPPPSPLPCAPERTL